MMQLQSFNTSSQADLWTPSTVLPWISMITQPRNHLKFGSAFISTTRRKVPQRPTLDSTINVKFSSVQFSRSVVSDSLRPHESQHARPPCRSPTNISKSKMGDGSGKLVQTTLYSSLNDRTSLDFFLEEVSPFWINICCCFSAESCPTPLTPWTVAHQIPLSVGFPRQE